MRPTQSEIRVQLPNSLPVTATTEAWLTALILSLPGPHLHRVIELVQRYQEGALVGRGPQNGRTTR